MSMPHVYSMSMELPSIVPERMMAENYIFTLWLPVVTVRDGCDGFCDSGGGV
jgi:hypothetical protein